MPEGQPAHCVIACSPIVAAGHLAGASGHLAGASGHLAEESQHLRGAFQPQDSTHLWPAQSPWEFPEHRSSGLLKSMCSAYPFSDIVRSHWAGCRTLTSESEQKTVVSLSVAKKLGNRRKAAQKNSTKKIERGAHSRYPFAYSSNPCVVAKGRRTEGGRGC